MLCVSFWTNISCVIFFIYLKILHYKIYFKHTIVFMRSINLGIWILSSLSLIFFPLCSSQSFTYVFLSSLHHIFFLLLINNCWIRKMREGLTQSAENDPFFNLDQFIFDFRQVQINNPKPNISINTALSTRETNRIQPNA
jgi:hypothetical protein